MSNFSSGVRGGGCQALWRSLISPNSHPSLIAGPSALLSIETKLHQSKQF
jgi:hypothetical protein